MNIPAKNKYPSKVALPAHSAGLSGKEISSILCPSTSGLEPATRDFTKKKQLVILDL
jgi:hypothetical protein